MSGEILYDLRKWMPGHGENNLSISFEMQNLIVKVRYDGNSGQEDSKLIKFLDVSFHSVGSFPGVPSIAGTYDCDFHTGCVIKAENSDLSAQWIAYWMKSGIRRRCCHFVMFWGSENRVVHAIAEAVELV